MPHALAVCHTRRKEPGQPPSGRDSVREPSSHKLRSLSRNTFSFCIATPMAVTIDGFPIGNHIYWALLLTVRGYMFTDHYIEPSIISGTGSALWTGTNFGPTGHLHPPCVCTVPSASAIFNCILEAEFCEAVQHRLRLCLHYLSCVKMAAFQFYLQPRNRVM
jgi:hypothetical protein